MAESLELIRCELFGAKTANVNLRKPGTGVSMTLSHLCLVTWKSWDTASPPKITLFLNHCLQIACSIEYVTLVFQKLIVLDAERVKPNWS